MTVVPSAFHRGGSEEGAIAVIIVLCLTALLGMVVLVVDVGGLLTMRRKMITTADSAALAAAQSCAKNDAGSASAQADALANANVSSATRQSYAYGPQGCGTSPSGTVTVEYSALQKLFFAPILGSDDTLNVPAEATALWGPSAGGSAPPLVVSSDSTGAFPCAATVPQNCNFWFDNTGAGTSNSSWGFLSLDTSNGNWPANLAGNSPTRSCSTSGSSSIISWISSGGVEVSLVADPNVTPTYVCADSGTRGGGQVNNSQMGQVINSLVGETWLFPVNQPPQPDTTPGREKYAIMGFIPLTVSEVIPGNDPRAYGSPAQSGTCDTTPPLPLTPQNPTYVVTGDRMACELEHQSPDTVTVTPLVYDGNRQAVLGTDYEYNATTDTIRWIKFGNPGGGGGGGGGGGNPGGGNNNSVTPEIRFTWTSPATPGLCGAQTSDPNAWCLVTSFAGPIVGGFDACLTCPDFGVRSIRLSG